MSEKNSVYMAVSTLSFNTGVADGGLYRIDALDRLEGNWDYPSNPNAWRDMIRRGQQAVETIAEAIDDPYPWTKEDLVNMSRRQYIIGARFGARQARLRARRGE